MALLLSDSLEETMSTASADTAAVGVKRVGAGVVDEETPAKRGKVHGAYLHIPVVLLCGGLRPLDPPAGYHIGPQGPLIL